jgi:hypothetical protein
MGLLIEMCVQSCYLRKARELCVLPKSTKFILQNSRHDVPTYINLGNSSLLILEDRLPYLVTQ